MYIIVMLVLNIIPVTQWYWSKLWKLFQLFSMAHAFPIHLFMCNMCSEIQTINYCSTSAGTDQILNVATKTGCPVWSRDFLVQLNEEKLGKKEHSIFISWNETVKFTKCLVFYINHVFLFLALKTQFILIWPVWYSGIWLSLLVTPLGLIFQ